jgi:hypothetical protein
VTAVVVCSIARVSGLDVIEAMSCWSAVLACPSPNTTPASIACQLSGSSDPIALIGTTEKGYLTLELKVAGPGGH